MLATLDKPTYHPSAGVVTVAALATTLAESHLPTPDMAGQLCRCGDRTGTLIEHERHVEVAMAEFTEARR